MWLKPAKMASFDWAAPGKLLFFITQFSRGEKDKVNHGCFITKNLGNGLFETD